jgi:hypothetical protein
MRKLMIALTATAALVLCGSVAWVAQASPLTGAIGTPSQELSPLEKIGCQTAGDNCPYGQRIVRGGGGRWWCEPCWPQKHGQKYWGGGDQGYGQRHYREDHSEGPPPGWRSYHERPYGWQERNCMQIGPLWYCP